MVQSRRNQQSLIGSLGSDSCDAEVTLSKADVVLSFTLEVSVFILFTFVKPFYSQLKLVFKIFTSTVRNFKEIP
jgi:hypothetical protein